LGDKGKRSLLLDHSTLKINADLVSRNEHAWTEESIRSRTADMISAIIAIWPRPAEAVSEPTEALGSEVWREPDISEAQEIADAAGYRPLVVWLGEQAEDDIPMDFDLVEEVLGAPLPAAARAGTSLWHDPHEPLWAAVAAAGFRPTAVDLVEEKVTFSRVGRPATGDEVEA
jgi:hypothetical protein